MQLHSQPEMVSVFNELETSRQKIAKYYKVAYWIAGITAVVFLVSLFLGALVLAFVALIGGFVFGGGTTLLVQNRAAQYRLQFKQKIISNVLLEVDNSLQILPNSGISEKDFIDSYLFTTRPDSYKTEDLIHGKIGKTQVHFAEVLARYKTSNGKQTTWHDIFKGIIFFADFNKGINAYTFVRPKKMGSEITNWISQNIFGNDKIVKLENVEFDKIFDTVSGNQIEARYILTPSLMEKLLELNQYTNSTISISFIWSNIYIAFPLNHNYFEPPIFRSLLNADVLEKDLNILRLMRHVVDELNLNTRIWTKE